MSTGADNIIARIFNRAAEDERTAPVLSGLRDAYATGRWNPARLAEVVEAATAAETRAES